MHACFCSFESERSRLIRRNRRVALLGRPGSRRSQKGAAAIELGLLFIIFFSLFYALASYALPMVMIQAFHHAAASGARAAVAVEPTDFTDTADYVDNGIKPRVQTVVGNLLDWLPSTAKSAVLGTSNQNVQVDFDAGTNQLTVTVVFTDYKNNPLMPILRLPGIGDVPRLPDDLRGTASLQL